MRQIALDTETTGLDPSSGHRIIEVACVELINRRVTGKTYHQYINPDREIDQGAIQVHGITNAFLTDKPRFNEIVENLIQFIDGAELIIHNAPFDVGFINHEFGLLKNFKNRLHDYCQVIDTLDMGRKMHPGQKNSLDALCKRYQVDNSNRTLHGALIDADLLAQVYLAMTGGQISLQFDTLPVMSEENATIENTTVHVQTAITSKLSLPIFYASEEEMALHEARIKEIAG
jgi:DNA polymerase-3 subunit epsilon